MLLPIDMWGNLVLSPYMNELNAGFSQNKSGVILHLLQWQYWWWFWFSFFFVFYYLVTLKVLFNRSFKFHPKINTSMRPRGRWGDMIIALIPLYWCVNILINSNSLLKILEWQDSAGMFTLRVRAKQWYWVYKISTASNIRLYDFNAEIGRKSSIRLSEKNDSEINRRVGGFWLNWRDVFNEKYAKIDGLEDNEDRAKAITFFKNGIHGFFDEQKHKLASQEAIEYFSEELKNKIKDKSWVDCDSYEFGLNWSNKYWFRSELNRLRIKFVGEDMDDFLYGSNEAQKRLPIVSKDHYINFVKSFDKNKIFSFSLLKDDAFKKEHRYFLTLRQKPLKKWDSFGNSLEFVYNNAIIPKYLRKKVGFQTSPYKDSFFISNNNRLLNTTTLLVLPTNTTISVITNSFDVIHSWFIPGLGLKLDCVPGRSTHHILRIDAPGFYYGQCAEICGRFHHHMPIKICAVPFEHFLAWWQHYFVYLNLEEDWEKALKINRHKYAGFFIR